MKKKILLLCMTMFSFQFPYAQQGSADLDINNARAKVLTCGDMFYNLNTYTPAYEFPKNSGKYCGGANGLWIGAFDNFTGALHVSAQIYRSSGLDFWPGPIEQNGVWIDSSESAKWDKIWKINKSDINTFLLSTPHTLSNTPASILDWPAKGNPYCKDATGASLAIVKPMADFVDANSDGMYNPIDGDYPLIKGEQMLWWVFNDNRLHTVTNSNPLQLEIFGKAYAFDCNASLKNVTFYDFEIRNFATNIWDSLVVGLWSDSDLGFAWDDYIGYDSVRNMAYTYNGDAFDDGPGGYGANLTKQGILMLQKSANHPPINNMSFYHNLMGATGNPVGNSDYYNYITGSWRDGLRLTRSCDGRNSTAPVTNFLYTDPPCLVGGFSEKSCVNLPYDRRIILGLKPQKVNPGSQPILLSYAILNTENDTTCSITALQELSDSVLVAVQNNFGNLCPTAPLSTPNTISENAVWKLYPNPCKNYLEIEFSDLRDKSGTTIVVTDILGQPMAIKVISTTKGFTLLTEQLANGCYFVSAKKDNQKWSYKFIKQ